ncbi:MAG: hypothetical protein ACP5UD_07540 [Conexivisphaera sp.]
MNPNEQQQAAPGVGAAAPSVSLDDYITPNPGNTYPGVIVAVSTPFTVHTEKFGDRLAIDITVDVSARKTQEKVRIFLPKRQIISEKTSLYKLLKATGCLASGETPWYKCILGRTVHVAYTDQGYARLVV